MNVDAPKDFDAAISWYEKILKTKKTADILYNIGILIVSILSVYKPISGNCYFMKEGYEQAIEFYHQSLELDGTRAECYYNLGNALVSIQNSDKAIEPFKKSCELDPTNIAAFYNLGNAYLLAKDVQNAQKAFEEIIRIEPNNYEWRYRIAQALADCGEIDLALTFAEGALKLKADDNETLFLKGSSNLYVESLLIQYA